LSPIRERCFCNGFRFAGDGHAALKKRIRDFLLICLQAIEGDPDLIFRHTCKADDPVYALEDRTYPRKCPSCGAAWDGQLERLLRSYKRPGKYEDQHETGQETEDCFPVHHAPP
jgi:hypothetical protein